jgi:hypothetical protein
MAFGFAEQALVVLAAGIVGWIAWSARKLIRHR